MNKELNEKELEQVAVLDADKVDAEDILDSFQELIANETAANESLEEGEDLTEAIGTDRLSTYAQEVKQWADALNVQQIDIVTTKTENKIVKSLVDLFKTTASQIKRNNVLHKKLPGLKVSASNDFSYPSALLTGLSGIGKTAIVYEVANVLGLQVHLFKPSALSKTNTIGLNYVVDVPVKDENGNIKKDANGEIITQPENMPITSKIWDTINEAPCIVLLDEMNRGVSKIDPSVIDAIMGFVDDHILPLNNDIEDKTNYRFFPNLVGVIATINPSGKVFNDVAELGNALINRMKVKFNVEPLVGPWAKYTIDSLEETNKEIINSGVVTADESDAENKVLLDIIRKNMFCISLVRRLAENAKLNNGFHFDTEEEIIKNRTSASSNDKNNKDLNPRSLSAILGDLVTGDVDEFRKLVNETAFFPESKNRIETALRNFTAQDKASISNSIFAQLKNVKPVKATAGQKQEMAKAAKVTVDDILNFNNPDLANLFGDPNMGAAVNNMNTTPQTDAAPSNNNIFGNSDDDLD